MTQRSDVTIAEFANISHMHINVSFGSSITTILLMIDDGLIPAPDT